MRSATMPGRSTACRSPWRSNIWRDLRRGAALQPVFADPIGPLQSADAEVRRDSRIRCCQLRFGEHRRGEKRRIEHLKCHAGGGDADAGQFADLAGCRPGGHDTKRLAQVIRNVLKGHWN